MKPVWLLILTTVIFVSCDTEPEQIEFGKDACAFCKMTMVDKKFGGELVNKNGKTIKFDCGECMVMYFKSVKDFKVSKFLVMDYANPGQMIDAEKAFYLHGGNIISPMGGRLAAFKTKGSAEKFLVELKGDLIFWDNVKELSL